MASLRTSTSRFWPHEATLATKSDRIWGNNLFKILKRVKNMWIQRLWVAFSVLAFGVIAWGLALALAAEPGSPAPAGAGHLKPNTVPTCALIDVSRSPLSAIVEARLLAKGDAIWLERSQIDKLLAEQELQAAFSPDAGRQRIALGRLLKADLLVILRTGQKEKQRFAELVVAETGSGLRLLARSLPLSGDLESDAAALAALVDEARAKYAQKITEVYAVPPFVSQDLTFEYEHLKAAYAALLEQTLMAQPEVLVVELAEAEALAKEYARAAPGEKLSRRLPIYLLGEYRHEGRGEELRVTLTLRVTRGEKQIEEFKQTIPPAEVPAWFRKVAARLLRQIDAAAAKFDPESEARQLTSRAKSFLELGDWPEAIALLEASLLLKPDQPEAHRQAMYAASRQALKADVAKTTGLEEILRLRCQAFMHFKHLALRDADKTPDLAEQFFTQFHQTHILFRRVPKERAGRYAEQWRAEKALFSQLLERSADRGDWQLARTYFSYALDGLEPRVRYAEQANFILKYQNRPGFTEHVREFMEHRLGDSLEGEQYIKGLIDSPEANAEVKKVAQSLIRGRASNARNRIAILQTEPRQTDPHPAAPSLSFLPLDLFYEYMGQRRRVTFCGGCLALDNGIDVFWGDTIPVLLTKHRGEGRPVWKDSRRGWGVKRLVYDGRYLWLIADDKIAVVDPVAETAWEFSEEHGLPRMREGDAGWVHLNPETVVAPVNPGEAILASYTSGSIRTGRTWVAHATIDPTGKRRLRVIHEARKVLAADAQGKSDAELFKLLSDPQLAFQPLYAATRQVVGPDGQPVKQVLIGRRILSSQFLRHRMMTPLVVDPRDLSVRVQRPEEDPGPRPFRPADEYQGTRYFLGVTQGKVGRLTLSLFGIGPPEFRPVELYRDAPEGEVRCDGQTIHVVGKEWWRGPIAGGKLTSLGPVPWVFYETFGPSRPFRKAQQGDLELRGLWHTNHYGFIVSCQERGGPTGLAEVCFDGSGRPLRDALREVDSDAREPSPRPPQSLVVHRPAPDAREVLWMSNFRRLYREIAYTPDGQFILTTCLNHDNTPSILVWEASDGRLLAEIRGLPASLSRLAVSRRGRYFATGDTQGRVVVWTTSELKPLYWFHEHSRAIRNLVFSWDDRRLAALDQENRLRVWNLQTGRAEAWLHKDTRDPDWIEFTPDGTRLIARDTGRQVRYLDPADGHPIGRVEALADPFFFLPDKTLLASLNAFGNPLIAWDCAKNTYRKVCEVFPGRPVAVSHDGKWLAVLDHDTFARGRGTNFSRLRLMEMATEREILNTPFLGTPFGYAFSPKGDLFVVLDTLGRIWGWKLDRPLAGYPAVAHQAKGSTRDSAARESKPAAEPAEVSEFGQFIDPDGDCSLKIQGPRLSLTVPGKLHTFSAEQRVYNAPRLLQDVEGDFIAEVKVETAFQLGTAQGGDFYQGAGLILLKDERNYVRLEQAATLPPGEKTPRIVAALELRLDGTPPANIRSAAPFYLDPKETSCLLRIERRGRILAGYVITSSAWAPVLNQVIDLPPKLKLGLIATNTSASPVTSTFTSFQMIDRR